jgi:MoaA/NifB/PqqE/SkfB family radical SAM enzyme
MTNSKHSSFIWFDDRQALDYLIKNNQNKLPSISISCMPTCNMFCPHCIYATPPSTKSLLVKQKLKILKDAHKLGAQYLQICHQGEPFLDKSVIPLVEKATNYGMKTFIYTNASLITSEIAEFLLKNEVCLGVHFDSLYPKVFDKMLGSNGGSKLIYNGLKNLLRAGYNKPFKRNNKYYTRLAIVTTLTSINTQNIDELKQLANYAWDNHIFFGIARLEKGGRAINEVWRKMRVRNKQKIIDFVNWCSEQVSINYWEAQPKPYCIGVSGLQVADNGDVWITEYGGSCDFTEPDGESFPENIIKMGNVETDGIEKILQRVWGFRAAVFYNGILDRKLKEYERTKDIYPNGLQDCGSAKTYTLFVPYYNFVKGIVENI